MNASGVQECQRVERMITSVLTPPLAIFGWGAAGCLVIVAVWVGTVAPTDDQIARISNPTGMIGKRVIDVEGNHVGRIEDAVFHWEGDGYREYAVLSLGRVVGGGETHVAVPAERLSASRWGNHFVLNVNNAHPNGDPEVIIYRFYDRSLTAAYGAGGATVVTSTYALYPEGRPHVCECFWSDVLRDTEFNATRIRQIHVVTGQ